LTLGEPNRTENQQQAERVAADLRESEERFRSFAENSADTLWIVDAASGRLEYLSPAFEVMWGESREKVMADLGRWAELVHPEDRDRAMSIGMPRLLAGETVQQQYRIIRASDGETRWILDTGFPIRGADGAITRLAGIAQDFTHHHLAQEALRQSEERFRLAAMAVEGMIFDWDVPTGRVVRSAGLEALLGFKPEEVEPTSAWWRARVHPDDVAANGRPAQRAMEAGHQRFEVEYRVRHRDGRWVNIRDTGYVVYNDEGKPCRAVGTSVDITHREQTEQALRASEERLRLIIDSARDYAIFTLDKDGDVDSWPPGAEAVFGWSAEEMIGRNSASLFVPEDQARGVPARELEEARKTGFAPDVRWHLRRNGSRVFIEGSSRALLDDRGKLRGYLKIGQDVTQRREVEEALRESEARFRTLATSMPQLVFRSKSTGERTWNSPQWEAFTGLSDMQCRGLGWLDAIHPDDQAATMEAWTEAARSGEYQAEYRVQRASDGQYRWHQARAVPLEEDEGAEVEWVGACADVHELKALQAQQRILLAELQHRVRNTLAVVRAIARRTAATSENVDDLAMHLDGRLNSFARTQAMVTRDPVFGVDLGYLVAEELAAYGGREGEQVTISGPQIRLKAKAAETIGLAIHELATNAVKYGALADPGGTVTVTWTIIDGEGGSQSALALEWAERLARTVAAPSRRGFGTELLERTLAYELNAVASRSFAGRNVSWRLKIPLTAYLVADSKEAQDGAPGAQGQFDMRARMEQFGR
jgi:PAS domain S-box-containing protein